MKHHKHAIGWRTANRLTSSHLAQDVLALVACHVIVIGLMTMAIWGIKNNW
jgi:hypothetical protein